MQSSARSANSELPNFPTAEPEKLASLHCKPGHAVLIEPGLRSRSPENGSISNIRRRLSAISLPGTPIPEPGETDGQFAKARR